MPMAPSRAASSLREALSRHAQVAGRVLREQIPEPSGAHPAVAQHVLERVAVEDRRELLEDLRQRRAQVELERRLPPRRECSGEWGR